VLLTPHILAGVAIVTLTPNPILGLIFVLLSHYFLDLFPHKEYTIKTIRAGQWSKSLPDFLKVFLDIILGLGYLRAVLSRENNRLAEQIEDLIKNHNVFLL